MAEVYTGLIYDISSTDRGTYIIMKKKNRDKFVLVAIKIFGFWKDKALNEMKLKPKDRITGKVYAESEQYKGNWYTNLYFNQILLIRPAPVKMGKHNEPKLCDENTGVLIR